MLALEVGIYSFVYSGLFIAIITPLVLLNSCWKYGYLPRGEEWGNITRGHFVQVFGYGKDIFLMNIGSQLINTSQLIIVSRCLGLSAAAVWAIGTKMFNLIIPLMCRPLGAAIPGMSEMLVRGEDERLYTRFREMVVVTSSVGVFLGVSYALCNSSFIFLWTHGKITWSPSNDLLLGLWVIISSMQTTHGNFVSVTKQIAGMSYIYFAEGLCFVVMGLMVAPHLGIAGIITSSIISTLTFSYQYSIRRSSKYFSETLWEISVDWILPSIKYAAIFLPLALSLAFFTELLQPLQELVIRAIVSVLIGGGLLLKIGMPKKINQELAKRVPSYWVKFVS
jgi:O-antigen/teichoic acid export membrane protein